MLRVLHSTKEEVLIFNTLLEKRLAVQAIETSFRIILLSDKKVSIHYELKQRKKFNKFGMSICFNAKLSISFVSKK
jgi:hypothetical protein